MPVPAIVWAGIAVAGVLGFGWAAKETGEAAESATKPLKWLVAGGTIYVSYRALQAAGALK